MIYGTGIDIIEVDRIERQINEATRFREKIFSLAEIEYCESFKVNKAEHYAVRFAAKEAFLKALGTGYRDGLAFREIEILNDSLGKPEVHLTGNAKTLAIQKGFERFHVSMSHLKSIACATVIIETKER